MGSGRVHGRVHGSPGVPMQRAMPPVVLMGLLLVIAAGCGARRDTSRPAAGREPDTLSTAGAAASHAKAATRSDENVAARHESTAPGKSNRVRLIQHGCVQFEPHWTTVRIGQSITWQSELKVPVTLHVPAGAFDHTEYVVRAGQTLSSGPAHSRGTYPIWTAPTACQGIARGVQGSGPGVTVEAAAAR